MDLIITLLVILCISIYKTVKTGGFDKEIPPVLQENEFAIPNKKDIPIGNNLMLKRELEPFTFIIKQLGLRV